MQALLPIRQSRRGIKREHTDPGYFHRLLRLGGVRRRQEAKRNEADDPEGAEPPIGLLTSTPPDDLLLSVQPTS